MEIKTRYDLANKILNIIEYNVTDNRKTINEISKLSYGILREKVAEEELK